MKISQSGLLRSTRVLVEQTTVVDPQRLGRSAGRLEAPELRAVDEALLLVLGLWNPVDESVSVSPWWRKSDLDPLGPFLVDAITVALDAENLPHDALGDLDGTNIRIARTASRRVLGFMNEIAVHIDYALDRYGNVLDVDVITLNRQLQRTPHNHGGSYVFPLDLVAERAQRPGRE